MSQDVIASKIFDATDASDASALDDSPKRYVAKLCWPYISGFKEEEPIIKTHGVVHDLGNHLPRVIGFCNIDPMGTFRIRQELDVNPATSSARALRMIIFERHYVLWHSNIRHQDISLGNLMVRTIGDRYYGVLNDWDLSSWEGHGKFEADLTATVSYVAIHLLTLWESDLKADRIYYFELESFFWCMIWTFLAVKDKKLRPTPAMASWLTGDISRSADVRGGYFRRPQRFQDHEAWRPYQKMRLMISEWIRCRNRGHDTVVGVVTPMMGCVYLM